MLADKTRQIWLTCSWSSSK